MDDNTNLTTDKIIQLIDKFKSLPPVLNLIEINSSDYDQMTSLFPIAQYVYKPNLSYNVILRINDKIIPSTAKLTFSNESVKIICLITGTLIAVKD